MELTEKLPTKRRTSSHVELSVKQKELSHEPRSHEMRIERPR